MRGWSIYDNSPGGASIANRSDSTGRHIDLSGSGTSNGFRLGSSNTQGSLNITDLPIASWRMKNSGPFTIYFAVQTTRGQRYIAYNHGVESTARGSETYILSGLGNKATSGDWSSFQRNLSDDLATAQPGNALTAIHGVLIRGSMSIDDIAFASEAGAETGGGDTSNGNALPVAKATVNIDTVTLGDSVTLDGSASVDSDGQIVDFQWRDSAGKLIGEGESLKWQPPSARDHTVTLTVIDNDDGKSRDTVTITANELTDRVPNLNDYVQVFGDEFDGTTLDPAKWDTGLLWGPYLQINNEEQIYVDTLGMHKDFAHDPFTVSDGTLKITATPVSGSLKPPARPPEDSPLWKPYPYSEYQYNDAIGQPGKIDYIPGYEEDDINYLSGILTTYGTFRMSHGYVEARAKLPKGKGLWPAFWMLPLHYVQDVPEIDIMEYLGQDEIHHTYHYFDIKDNYRKTSTPSFTTTGKDWTESFHTFGMAWSPTRIIWYVDGEEVHRVTDSEYRIANQAMYLIANLAVGGNWPGAPDENTQFPATFELDYIRAYKKRQASTLNISRDYQLVFNDEFTGSSLDSSKWNTAFLWGPYLPINNEEQYYVDALGSDKDAGPSPFSLKDGVLSIIARDADDPEGFRIPDKLPEPDDSIWTSYPTFRQNGDYTPPNYSSGIITSYDSFKFANGYAEIRAKIPKGDGLWPAFWLLNGYYISQQPEIDIMEVRGENPHQIVHSFHRLEQGVQKSVSFTTDNRDPDVGYSDDFHTYGVRWQPGRIDWYIDRKVVQTYTGDDAPYQLMYLIANLAVGGDFNFSPVDTSLFPAQLDIDYIRVYQGKDTK